MSGVCRRKGGGGRMPRDRLQVGTLSIAAGERGGKLPAGKIDYGLGLNLPLLVAPAIPLNRWRVKERAIPEMLYNDRKETPRGTPTAHP